MHTGRTMLRYRKAGTETYEEENGSGQEVSAKDNKIKKTLTLKHERRKLPTIHGDAQKYRATGYPALVVFCNASRLAFGACAYMKWKLNDGQFGKGFVTAKAIVAPLKELTIPRGLL